MTENCTRNSSVVVFCCIYFIVVVFIPRTKYDGKVMFSVRLSVHRMRGGTPASGCRSLPCLWSQVLSGGKGYSSLLSQVLSPGEGKGKRRGEKAPQSGPRSVVPSSPWPGPRWGDGGGYPSQVLGQRYPSPGQHMPWTGYTTGSTPLAVTQKDFLVFLFLISVFFFFFFFFCFSRLRMPIHIFLTENIKIHFYIEYKITSPFAKVFWRIYSCINL